MNLDNPYIAFDESGNTGSFLLDSDQPVFVLASVKLTQGQTKNLKRLLNSEAKEVKFSQLKKSKKSHSNIISVLNHEIVTDDTIKIFLLHKEYSIWVHTVDRFIEPLAYMDGFDLYHEGGNIALTNLFYYLTKTYCNPEALQEYQEKFFQLFKKKDQTSIIEFYSSVRKLIESSTHEDFKKELSIILASERIIDDILKGFDKYSFDSTLTGFITLVDYWGRKTDKKFDAYVDDSKPLTYYKDYLDVIKRINIEKEIGTDRRTLKLPLMLNDVKFVDSVDNEIVQIADFFAGAANHYSRSLIDGKFMDELAEKIAKTKLIERFLSPVWPHPGFTPETLNTNYNPGRNLLDDLNDLTNP